MDLLRYDFGYEWPWTWGHAIAALVFTALAITFARLAWKWWSAACAALAVWAVAGAIILNLVFRFSLPIALPTEQFLAAGQGRVLDAGAGSGRSTLMVLLARRSATVTALDIFGTEYGISGNPDRTLSTNQGALPPSNLRIAR